MSNSISANKKKEPTIYAVIVQYGDKLNRDILRLSRLLQKYHNCTTFIIRTDINQAHRYLKNTNEAMEFSGYQEGLLTVLSHCAEASIPNNDSASIIFINDTIITGHTTYYWRLLIRIIVQYAIKNKNTKNIFTGITSPLPESFRTHYGSHSYISTWLFAIKADISALKDFKFYNESEKFSNFETHTSSKLPKSYFQAILKWIEPNHWLKGWYKATPGIPLPPTEKRRKIMSIYLEHQLPIKLNKFNIKTVDIRLHLSAWLKLLTLILINIDRIYINAIKIKYRITYTTKKKLNLI